MAWNPIDSPCDYILLDEKKSPGIAEINGASSVRQWDEREGFGLSGAISVFKGRGLAKFAVTLRLYTDEDWEAWHAWKPLVDRLPTRKGGKGKDSGVLKIYHPLLELLDITDVAVTDVMQAVQTNDGEWTVEIRFIEFRHPKLTLAKPEGAPPAGEVDYMEELVIKPLTKMFTDLAGGA